MRYSYRKPHRVKRRKPILRSPIFRIGVLFSAAIIGLSYLLFFSGFFQIKKIIISGDKIISEDNIPRQNIFLIDITRIKKDILNNFPQVFSIEINRNFPATLNIFITKKIARALWCEAEKCFLIDDRGREFQEAPAETDLVRIAGLKEMLNEEKVSQILKIQKELKDKFIATTTQAFIASKERLNIKTSEGWEIYFNLEGDLDWQLQELKLVLEKQITPEKKRNLEYIDLRFSRVYYK